MTRYVYYCPVYNVNELLAIVWETAQLADILRGESGTKTGEWLSDKNEMLECEIVDG